MAPLFSSDLAPPRTGHGGRRGTLIWPRLLESGGDTPPIFLWAALPQISFRYKPIKQFQMKLDVGFSITGFFFGLSASSYIPSSSDSSSGGSGK